MQYRRHVLIRYIHTHIIIHNLYLTIVCSACVSMCCFPFMSRLIGLTTRQREHATKDTHVIIIIFWRYIIRFHVTLYKINIIQSDFFKDKH